MKKKHYLLFAIVIVIAFTSSCSQNNGSGENGKGFLEFDFTHRVGDEPLQFDTMIYVNAAGNQFLVSEIQYFVSDVTLYKSDGTDITIKDGKGFHYVDTDLPETWRWKIADSIPAGTYDSITFRFGISKERNRSLMFVNPPESNMFWPQFLGGGYHYMKLNGKWKDTLGEVRLFNFHMGIGQTYDENEKITGFIHNDFVVSLKNSGFKMPSGDTVVFNVVMDVNEWFEDPHVYDFNYWGGKIMQNQEAMRAAGENGHNVFSLVRK